MKLTAILERFAVQREYQVSRTQPHSSGRASRHDIRHNDAEVAREIQAGCQYRRHCLGPDPNISTAYLSGLPNLLVHSSNNIARCGKTESLVAACLGNDQSVDAHEPTAHIDQRAATAARIDGRIRLNVNHR